MMNPFKSKKGLGRGLSSLIGDSQSSEAKTKISISSIIRNKYQPRKKFDKESLEEIYTEIDQLEKTIVEQTEFEEKDEQYYWFAIASLVLFVFGFISEKVIFKSIV